MLILSRKIGESVIVNGNIKVLILNVSGAQVKVGIEAPPDVTIHREEIQEKINGHTDG